MPCKRLATPWNGVTTHRGAKSPNSFQLLEIFLWWETYKSTARNSFGQLCTLRCSTAFSLRGSATQNLLNSQLCFTVLKLKLYVCMCMCCMWDGLGVEDFGCHYWLQVVIWEASQSNCCLCLDEGWHLEEDNECFSRCHCSCQVLLGIYTPCARACPVILVAVIKVGDITVAVIWVGSEVWSFWSRSLRSRSFRSWSFLSVF